MMSKRDVDDRSEPWRPSPDHPGAGTPVGERRENSGLVERAPGNFEMPFETLEHLITPT
ncbi:MAG: hypothetical protein K0Q72_1961, partial [Armatimonadetes bacterium]|nr:hypothetical protein [Armatimonadota bacterium]